ncbi:GNAT family N-acetyltransferase [Streptomyces sp. sk2.1]|uniref:GNAT family N-acetyltransferase n=1 Tax=Streptomyces sp. sk2.1 TaxID=2478959 RepID=UPI0011E79922|nr:GNAT family N-acetyltransferase [Streptomyces sp. sk2.1]TXS65096.1 methyltransferase domain-containing protein [Streptomyces sp. sk2.1]
MTDNDHTFRTETSSSPDRQDSGSDAATRRLLELAGPLPRRPRVLGLGRGPGRALLPLAAEAGAEVTAVDPHQPFLDELRAAADARGLGDRVRTLRADTAGPSGPGLPDGSFDLVLAEGATHLTGLGTALRDWKRLLAPGGSLVLTDCVQTTGTPTAGARACSDRRPPAPGIAAAVAAGYHVLGSSARPDDHGAEHGCAVHVLRPVDPRWPARPETPADRAAVFAVNAAAFPTPDEAALVDALRDDPAAWLPGLGHVVTDGPDGDVVAYALLTRCLVGDAPALALAPVATVPDRQRRGAGRAAVRAALDAARLRGESLVLVLGHPEYYPAFGFVPASRYGIRPGFDVPDEAMMALVLDGSVPVPRGTIHYPAAFGV